jgi:hypothetical protein
VTRDELQMTYLVLNEYTDEYLDAAVTDREDRWATAMRELRTVPADWRQSIMASAHHQAYRLVVGEGGLLQAATTVDLFDAVIDRVATFKMGWRPLRVESVLVSPSPLIPRPRDGEDG